MKYNLCIDHAEPEIIPTIESMLQDQMDIHSSFDAIAQEMGPVDEVQTIIDNIDFAMSAISKYGTNAIKVINIDGSLENLLGISEQLITAEKAIEGLSNAAHAAWEKIKEWFRSFADKVKALCAKIKAFFIREKVVEKTIVKTVEKEVPVEIVKEVKVYVDKIIEKKVEVPVEPPVIMEELQQVPGYSEFMNELNRLRDITRNYGIAVKTVDNYMNDRLLDFIVGGKSIKDIITQSLPDDLYDSDGDYYRGFDYTKIRKIFSIDRYDVAQRFPVKNITEWSKDNYMKAWAIVESIYPSDLIIVISCVLDKINRSSKDVDSILLRNTDEYTTFMSEHINRKITRLGQDISDTNGNYSKITQNLSKLRYACSNLFSDAHQLISIRQKFVGVLNKVSHIYMKIDKFAEKTRDDAIWGAL